MTDERRNLIETALKYLSLAISHVCFRARSTSFHFALTAGETPALPARCELFSFTTPPPNFLKVETPDTAFSAVPTTAPNVGNRPNGLPAIKAKLLKQLRQACLLSVHRDKSGFE